MRAFADKAQAGRPIAASPSNGGNARARSAGRRSIPEIGGGGVRAAARTPPPPRLPRLEQAGDDQRGRPLGHQLRHPQEQRPHEVRCDRWRHGRRLRAQIEPLHPVDLHAVGAGVVSVASMAAGSWSTGRDRAEAEPGRGDREHARAAAEVGTATRAAPAPGAARGTCAWWRARRCRTPDPGSITRSIASGRAGCPRVGARRHARPRGPGGEIAASARPSRRPPPRRGRSPARRRRSASPSAAAPAARRARRRARTRRSPRRRPARSPRARARAARQHPLGVLGRRPDREADQRSARLTFDSSDSSPARARLSSVSEPRSSVEQLALARR